MQATESPIRIHRLTEQGDIFSKQVHEIRKTVFVEEQGVSPELEYDEFEKTSVHYLVITDGIPVGTGRWRTTEKGIKLERFAILKEYRNRQVGAALLKKVMEDILPLKKEVYLHAQTPSLKFYLRHGFVATGDPFYEAGIEHFRMHFAGTEK